MLFVDHLKIVQIQELQPGDIARLPDKANALVIATFNQRDPFVFLEGFADNFQFVERHDFFGPAIVLDDVRFEVDPLSAVRETDQAGCLSIHRNELTLSTKFQGHIGHASIRKGLDNEVNLRLFFKKWRMMQKNGDCETVLFEHAVEQPMVIVM